jgi:hypothetical protein
VFLELHVRAVATGIAYLCVRLLAFLDIVASRGTFFYQESGLSPAKPGSGNTRTFCCLLH